MKTKTILATLGLLLFCAAGLQAQRLELAPFYGYRFGGDVQNPNTHQKYEFQASESYGLVLDMPLRKTSTKLELLWSRQDTSVNLQGLAGMGRVKLSVDQFQLGGISESGDEHLRQYVSVLIGATQYVPQGFDSENRFSVSLGVGVKYFLSSKLSLRADLRGYCTLVDTSGGFISTGSGGTVVAFSGTAALQGEATVGLCLKF